VGLLLLGKAAVLAHWFEPPLAAEMDDQRQRADGPNQSQGRYRNEAEGAVSEQANARAEAMRGKPARPVRAHARPCNSWASRGLAARMLLVRCERPELGYEHARDHADGEAGATAHGSVRPSPP
jgi:hypothetical protein